MWERLDQPTKVIGAIVAAAVPIVGALVLLLGKPFSPDPREEQARTSPAAVASYQISRCMEDHGLGSARVETRTQTKDVPIVDTHRTFKRCEWPPPTPASVDGYTAVEDTIKTYLNRGAASAFNELHILRAPCAKLAVSFVLHHMSSRTFRDANLKPGPVYLVTVAVRNRQGAVGVRALAEVPFVVQPDLPPPRQGEDFIVLLNGHINLLDARCVAE